MHRGRLLVISGPSGVGKGSICKKVIEKKKNDVEFSVSMTTRPPREGEVDGENYFFVTTEEFKKKIEENGFLEHARVFKNYYGTPRANVMEKLEAGRDVILEIDIQGAMNIKKAYPEGIFIFILPPSMAELRKRITGRGTESESVIELRLGEALKEISYLDKYDYCVVNEDLDEAAENVIAIITAEHSKVTENIYDMIDKYKEEI
ncbi:MAG: guanylate kinase [Eubacteriaceae bacterium]|jgi:guanylate kinase|nr:guanylate kinase [Eubacteriaceae bacterium]